ncbi:MAG TPA: ABC transporter ATP-binding protein [Solirubrobacteraceae bacterium]|jgi:ABC-type multidrug transport system ATPase subunit|nr:ABC transporter ATP-binding protein [Solirubrobacteraceae bacterium]
MTNVIEVTSLCKRYGDLEAVRGVSFAVAPGEVFCLLGPNGAGKTSITEILEGYRTRTGGSVSVLGMDPARGARALRERVGIVLQSCGVQPDLTVAELLEMYGCYHRTRRPIGELIELVELEAKRDTRANQLSGGQRRRLDLALALVGDPDLVFLDEPTTGFDPAARRHAWSTIRSLCELGKTVFLTTHFMDEAQFLAHRVAVMRAGEIVALGRPEELGGRDLRPTEIRFTLPGGRSLADLPEVPAVAIALEGDRALISSHEGVLATQRITSWALAEGMELEHFTVAQPSLEDVYLELTGGETGDDVNGETGDDVNGGTGHGVNGEPRGPGGPAGERDGERIEVLR